MRKYQKSSVSKFPTGIAENPDKDLYLHQPTKRSAPDAKPTLMDLLLSCAVSNNEGGLVIPVKVDVDTSDVEKALDKTKQLIALEEEAGRINNNIIDVTDLQDKDKEKLIYQGYELKRDRVLAVKRAGAV